MKTQDPALYLAARLTLALLAVLFIYIASQLRVSGNYHAVAEVLTSRAFWSAAAVGFLAQAVDGALGMAYGVTATTFLLSSGASPAIAAAVGSRPRTSRPG